MNFFAHAHMARERSRDVAFLLGSMLPDFATMSGARLGPSEHAELSAGIAEHHRTDDAFHGGATFIEGCRETARRLEARGLSWGASRAAAHLGIELFLDGELVAAEAATGRDYLAAIDAAHEERLGRWVAFRDEGGEGRFRSLHARLSRVGLPVRYRDPEFVCEVLVRILEPRPRLTVEPALHGALREELVALQGRVVRDAASLVEETRAALRSK